ncbi:MAG TPA: ABC transporter ATP-binding protein [Burkholderiales bacterium]|nr:ABC transporter ATP-binding protein [Burkholderiales bacterium]
MAARQVEACVVMELRAEALAYGYPGRIVGNDVEVALAAGEVVCVLGPNGGGKTTLFRTLLGLLPVQNGHIALGGRPLQDWSRRNLARVVGYVPQAHAANFAFSVREIVLMGRTAHIGAFAAPSHRDREAADAALATLGIAHLGDRAYTEVSGGERQLALIARALAQEAELLLLDEPTASLDFGNQLRVLDQLRALAERGIGVLFSTHDPDHAFLCAERVVMLRDGRILATGRPAEVITRDNLQRLYGVDVEIVTATLSDGRASHLCVPGLAGMRATHRPRPAPAH